MNRIVTYAHRHKRPSSKRQAVALDVPAVVRAGEKDRRGSTEAAARVVETKLTRSDRAGRGNLSIPADNHRKPAIVTIHRHKHAKHAYFEELTEEELHRRTDAAAVLWRDIVRRATGKDRP